MSAYPSSRLAYFGLAKQSVFGTPVAPTTFIRWLDGSQLIPDPKFSEINEGDGSADFSQVFKEKQMWKGKIVFYPRPVELGLILESIMGSASDTASGGTLVSTTLASGASAGATTVSLTATITNGQTIVIGTGATAEIRTSSAVSGAGPYTVTVPALAFAHLSGETVKTVHTHTYVPTDVNSYYTFEFGMNDTNISAGNSLIHRVQDVVFTQLEIEGESNKPLKVTAECVGRFAVSQGSRATVTLEAGDPFKYVNGLFLVNTTNRGADMAKWKFTMQRGVDDDLMTNSIFPVDFAWTTRKFMFDAELLFKTNQDFNLMFFGSTAGTTDSPNNGTGAVDLTVYRLGSTNDLTYQFKLNNIVYQGKPPTPKLDGKAWRTELTALALRPTTGNICDMVLKNTLNTAY